MAHKIYTTKALILESWPSRERDRIILCYSRDLGLIYVRAIGVRRIVSKLRHSIEPFTLGEISVVRGRREWRLTNARLFTNLYQELKHDPNVLSVLLNTVRLLRRLVVGEIPEPALFDSLQKLLTHLSLECGKEEVEGIELLLVTYILHHLGYLSGNILSNLIGEHEELSSTLFETILEKRAHLLSHINSSLKETQL